MISTLCACGQYILYLVDDDNPYIMGDTKLRQLSYQSVQCNRLPSHGLYRILCPQNTVYLQQDIRTHGLYRTVGWALHIQIIDLFAEKWTSLKFRVLDYLRKQV